MHILSFQTLGPCATNGFAPLEATDPVKLSALYPLEVQHSPWKYTIPKGK